MNVYKNKIALRLIISAALSFIFLFFFLSVEKNSTTNYLAIISYILFVIMIFSCIGLAKSSIINPLNIFSLMYFGYVLGGLYYATSDGYFGKFLEFVDLEREITETYLIISLFFAIVSYIFFVLGYQSQSKILNDSFSPKKSFFDNYICRNYVYLSIPLLLVGAIYWVWVCNTIAGGVLNALIMFQVFPHLVEEHNVSILPYLLFYTGTNIWLIGLFSSKDNKGITSYLVYIIVALFGLVISLSTARISISLTYILSQLVFIYFVRNDFRRKIIIACSAIFAIGFVMFFLRELSNYYYLNEEIENIDFKFVESIVGGGNVADLQQLVIIFYSFDINNSLLGLSYLDWLNNSVGVFFGAEPRSIGLLVHDKYIPSSSGAPTPGAIGEAYANFNFLAPVFLFFIGWFFSYLHNKSIESNNLLVLFTYSNFLSCFVFLYPKVDSTMLVNFFWGAFPTVFFVGIIEILIYFLPKNKIYKLNRK